ncbi:MAG: WD40 repeat domain-containing protein [Bacteroidia bacterium]|nr:WD40 repeat domain-containing protein [Bacteroidia bacterium]MDW8158255.1 WD40 repeat domain-containing protein [Bacteroidia bacterium]
MIVRIKAKKLYEYTGHSQNIYALAKYEKLNQFFSAGGDGFVAVWNSQTGENVGAALKAPLPIYSLEIIEQQDLLVVGQIDGSTHFYNLAQKKLIKSTRVVNRPIFNFCYLPPNLLVACTGWGYLLCFDLNSFSCITQLQLSSNNLRCAAFAEKKSLLAIAGSDSKIRIYRFPSLELIQVLEYHTSSVFSICFSKTEELLYSAGRDAYIVVWDTTSFKKVEALPAHHFAINQIALSPSGQYLASASMDGTIKLWEAPFLRLVKVVDRTREEGHVASVNRILWLSQGQLISCGDDKMIFQWEFYKYGIGE